MPHNHFWVGLIVGVAAVYAYSYLRTRMMVGGKAA